PPPPPGRAAPPLAAAPGRRAEDARRVAEEERVRREAEEAAREAEQARLRRQAEEEARLRREAEALRLEKQRKAEEALLRAEEARRRAEAEAAAAAEKARAEAAAAASVPENEITVPTPIVDPNDVTQQVPAPDSSPTSCDEAETAMIPKIQDRSERPGAADETAVLPPVRDARGVRDVRATNPADRIPRGIFRDERPSGSVPESENERTRELPQIDDPHAGASRPVQERQERPARRPRPDWAEETPLDDLPTLADELLGDHRDQHDDGDSGRSGRGRRPRR
ncbi:dTMP kinase, partial [Streptomyces sp. NPDC059802]